MAGVISDSANRVLQLATQEAWRLNHDHLGTEHILAGLIKSESGAVNAVFDNFQADSRTMLLEMKQLVGEPFADFQADFDRQILRKKGMKPLPLSRQAKAALEFAIEEARSFNRDFVDPEHILIGLIRENDGIAGQVLDNNRLYLSNVREEVKKLLP